jgi:suppressor of ftsI
MAVLAFFAAAGIGGAGLSAASPQAAQPAQASPLPEPPQLRPVNGTTSLALTAAEAPDHRATLLYGDARIPPTIRVWPGDRLKIAYTNALPVHTSEQCALGTCMDMTNLHFHGMEVSPLAPQDDVVSMLAQPGQTLHYDLRIPANHPPGLFWYHPHPHGESAQQTLDGLSGAIVVDGIDRYVPAVRGLRERVLVVRTQDTPRDRRLRRDVLARLEVPAKDCGTSGEDVETFATVNGAVRPAIAIAPGERQFWRIVNAQPESFLDLSVDGEQLEVVALDGAPLAYRNPARPAMTVRHLLVPPAGRVEAIVTGPASGAHATLRSACVDTGPAGDINPAQVLADVVPAASPDEPMHTVPVSTRPPVFKRSDAAVAAAKTTPPSFVVRFTEGHHRFLINGKIFSPDAKPMTTVRVGTYQHWRIANKTHEMHPFHIHQVHFSTYAVNGRPVADPVWLDTVNVPPDSTVDTVIDFTDPVIRGVAVFHCHILNHEDKGMMAKVLFR